MPQRVSVKRRSVGAKLLACVAAVFSAMWACGCERRDPARTVVLYSSVDEPILRPVVRAFEDRTGLRVVVAGDTEATKTTGLALRLRGERNAPRADVWWSSEAMWTQRLADEGVLGRVPARLFEELASEESRAWPSELRGGDDRWIGFALRARVLCYNRELVAEADVPRTLRELADPRWAGRVVMARPAFGTTRAHMAALAHAWGPAELERWLGAMRANGLRLVDGNSTAVRAVALGEAFVCLTDTDDVWNGQAQGWPVDIVYESIEKATDGRAGADARRAWPSMGALVIPNTASIVAGGPNPAGAIELLRFLVGEESERMLAQSVSHNVPARERLARDFADLAIPTPWAVDGSDLARAESAAMEAVERVLGP